MIEPEPKSIETALATVPTGAVELSRLTPEQIDDRITALEHAVDAQRKISMAIIGKRLTPKDFIDFGGKPYLRGDGAARLLGVGIRLHAPQFEIERDGDDIFVECMLTAEWPMFGAQATQIGTCNTRDKFWDNTADGAMINQFRKKAEGNESLARRMLLGHVKKKALENATSRAVADVMGIKGMRWEDLAAIGFKPEGAGAHVDFKGKQEPSPPSQQQAATSSASPATPCLEPAPPRDPNLPMVQLAELERAPVGFQAHTTAQILQQWKNPKYWSFSVRDGDTKLYIKKWAKEDPPPFLEVGAVIEFQGVTVGEYQGKRQYIAEHVAPAG